VATIFKSRIRRLSNSAFLTNFLA